jgi:hypothetical protein
MPHTLAPSALDRVHSAAHRTARPATSPADAAQTARTRYAPAVAPPRVTTEVVLRPGVPITGAAAAALARHLADARPHGARALRLTVGNARTRLLTWKARDGVLAVSVHHALVAHPDDVLAILLERDGDAAARMRAIHAEARDPAATRQLRLGPARGSTYDLTALASEERERWLDGRVDVPIGWGRWSPRQPRRRSLRLGHFGWHPPHIAIHPVLDDPTVPELVVRFIVFHELLHGDSPPVKGGGRRRVVHSRAFRVRERAHPDHDAAEAWIDAHTPWLLARASGPTRR